MKHQCPTCGQLTDMPPEQLLPKVHFIYIARKGYRKEKYLNGYLLDKDEHYSIIKTIQGYTVKVPNDKVKEHHI